MGLDLIRRGPETVRLDVSRGAGLQAAARGQFDASVNNYPELATIQAAGCTGLRVYDYDAPGQPYWESTTGTSHTLTVIKTARRLVVRVENTTENTEVIMHVVPIPPYFVGLLRAWRGGSHGAKEVWPCRRINRWCRVGRAQNRQHRHPDTQRPDRNHHTASRIPAPHQHQHERCGHRHDQWPSNHQRKQRDSNRIHRRQRVRHCHLHHVANAGGGRRGA